MELKKIYTDLFDLLEVKSFDEISSRINEIINSPKKNQFVKKYQDFTHRFDFDPIQKAYQFYCADREGKKQDFTPPSLSELIAKITIDESDDVIMDICSGVGALTRSVNSHFKGKEFVCLELDNEIIPILIFIFLSYNINGWIIHTNVLTREIFDTTRIKDGEILKEIYLNEGIADCVISNPPFNIRIEPKEKFLSNNSNYSFIYEAILNSSNESKIAFILPNGVLVTNEEKISRKWLIENNLLEAVITLPSKMFDITSVAVCILLINKKKQNDFVKLIDHSDIFITEIVKKQGEGVARVYNKDRNYLTKQHINNIVDILKNDHESEILKIVSNQEIIDKDYSFLPNTYKAIDFTAPINDRLVEHIITDLNRVISHKNNVKLTINETIAKGTGILEIHESMKKSNKITDELNVFLHQLEQPKIESHKYLQLTKTKGEVKLEQDKSGMSSIMSMNLPVWSHQIHFLNKEENRLLAELRDWLLPRLMSGEIAV